MLPVPDAALAVFLLSLTFAHTFALLHLLDRHLKLLHDRFACLDRSGQAALIRSELLQLRGEKLGLDVLRSAIKQQQVRDIVVLELLLQVFEHIVSLPLDLAKAVQALLGILDSPLELLLFFAR